MEEEKKKRKKTVSSSSKIQKNKELTNDELLEQIMSKKKKNTSSKKNKTSKKVTANNTNTKLSNDIKKNIKETTDDELLDSILAKKKKRKAKTEVAKLDKDVVDNNALKKDLEDKVNQVESKEEFTNDLKKVEPAKDFELKEHVLESSKSNIRDDLIITREINFDEKLDLNNKKVLAQLRKAIEDFDNLEDLEEIHSSYESKDEETDNKEIIVNNKSLHDDSYLTDVVLNVDKRKPKVRYDNNEGKKLFLILTIAILIIILVLIISTVVRESFSSEDEPKIKNIVLDEPQINYELMEIQYQNCLARQFDERDITEDYIEAQNKLATYLSSNYKTSVSYENLNYGFKYNYNEAKVYYAASTIKALDALYIYTKASIGEINLDDTMVYSSKYKWSSSKEMSKYKYGSSVTIRDLVKYAVVVSDNSAHQMLVDYIGKNNLKQFGLDLGAKNVFNGSDNFGNIDTNDAIIYFRAINDFIVNNPELGNELKSFFLEAEQNDIAIPEYGILAGHKYGQYSSYYHDIGIVYDDSPYLVAILTMEGNKDFEAIVKDINKHVYELHKVFLNNRENVCKIEVYGN